MIAARRILVLTVVLFAALAFQATSAGAATSYRFTLAFGAFTKPTDVTVDQSNGNVYVTNSLANAIDILGSEGGSPAGGVVSQLTGGPEHTFRFEGEPSEAAFDESGGPSSGDLYVSDAKNNIVDKFQLNGITHEYEYICRFIGYGKGCTKEPAGAPSWTEPDGVAVDSHGNVYIASFGPGKGAVYEFNPQGEDIKELAGGDVGAGGGESGPVGVAIDSTGDLYVNNFEHSVVKIDTEGHESFLDNNGSTAVAVDSHGNVFVDDRTYIAEYDQAGVQINRFGEGIIGHSEGVAVNDSLDEVYATDQVAGDVEMFEAVALPEVETGASSNVHKASATVSGTVNPDEIESHYYFEYGTNTEYGSKTSEEPAGSGSAGLPVHASLAGLAAETTYHYRLVAVNKNGTNDGADQTFTTLPPVTFRPCSPIGLRGTSGTLCVLINPEGVETTYYFQYGTSTEYSFETPFENTGPLFEEKQFTAPITGLLPATTYHYRVVAFNELGLADGNDETFTTPPAEPTVNDQPPFASGISLHEATLHGTINPGNGVTTYHFQYGTSTEYGSSTSEAYTQLNYPKTISEDDTGEQLITGLQPGTTYHYRLVATNSSGTTTGPDKTFTTLAGAPPNVETGVANGISSSSATIAGTIDPFGQTAGYEFEVGTSTSYGTKLFGAISSREEVTVGLVGLLPETVYHYRLVASDAAGTTYGADQIFKTSGLLVTIAQPSTLALLPIPIFPPEKPIKPPPLKCKKGFVKKGGRCVRKHHVPPRKKRKK
jgi:hypothetical protein